MKKLLLAAVLISTSSMASAMTMEDIVKDVCAQDRDQYTCDRILKSSMTLAYALGRAELACEVGNKDACDTIYKEKDNIKELNLLQKWANKQYD
ncbi:hypothetical protein [Hafnia phage yong3]|nr:hypothetical protein [Hafnia phage yong3]